MSTLVRTSNGFPPFTAIFSAVQVLGIGLGVFRIEMTFCISRGGYVIKLLA